MTETLSHCHKLFNRKHTIYKNTFLKKKKKKTVAYVVKERIQNISVITSEYNAALNNNNSINKKIYKYRIFSNI